MAKNERAMSTTEFARIFWIPTLIAFLLGLIAVGFFFLEFWGVRDHNREWSRYDYDFFQALSGNEKGLRYEKLDALIAARDLRKIPEERMAQDLDIIYGLAMGLKHQGSIVKAEEKVRKQIVFGSISDSSKLTTVDADLAAIGVYSAQVNNNKHFRHPFDDAKRFESVKAILFEGGPAPEIQGIEKSLFPHWDFSWKFLLAIQFVAFAAYAFLCGVAIRRRCHPLCDLPKGSGSKLSILVTVPGSLPLMLVILLLSAPSRIKARIAQGSAKAKRFASIEEGVFSSQSSRESLERLKKRAEGR